MIGYLSEPQILGVWQALLSQVIVEPGVGAPSAAVFTVSGQQFFVALISGIILAFGFHLLLTNLSVAAGISYVGHSSSGSSHSSGGGGVPSGRKISTAFGVWTLVTVSLALFFACLLAVRLALFGSVLLGAITGLVIWGTYFCLLFWFSSTTVGSLIGSVVRTATSSFQSLVSTASSAFGARAASNQVVETAEATVAAVRRELAAAWSGTDVQETLQDYLMSLRSPSLNTEGLESEFERLIHESDITNLADRDTLSQINRDTFEKLVSSRTDLSREEVRRIADRLYGSWRKALGKAPNNEPMTELVDYLKTARPDATISEELGDRLDQLLTEYRQQNRSQQTGPLQQGISNGLNALLGIAMGRIDLSDLSVEKITRQLKQARAQVEGQVDTISRKVGSHQDEPYSVVKADVENYLLNTYPWQMQPTRLQTEFRNLLFDPQADPGVLRQELLRLNRAFFADVLRSRGLLTPEELRDTSLLLENVRRQVLAEVKDLYRLTAAKETQERVYTFLQQTPREELLSDRGPQAFRNLLEDPNAEPEDLQDRFSQFSYELFLQVLNARNDLNSTEAEAVASQLERAMHQVQADVQGAQQAAQARLENQWRGLQDYLRRTHKDELNPDGIKADIRTLMHEPDEGVHRIRQRLASFDRDTLVQLLSQRQDMSEAEVNQIVDQVEANWYQVIHTPRALAEQARAKYDEATTAITTYLRETGKPELNPEGIRRDLKTLINHPQAGMSAVRHRLAQMDRDTLVQLLSQREDLSEEEANRVIDDIQEAIRDVLKAPQRLARRTQAQLMSFEEALEDYLRSTEKEELNPAGIKRDLQLLLNDPRLGADRLQTRLSKVNRDTLVALLSQRPDMTREEAEAAVDRVLGVRDQILNQITAVQEQIKGVVRSLLARIRRYLNSLDRPELNYYGIKQDLRKLMDDPQAGAEALRIRLGQFDRNTLVALLSSHNAISEADANRVIDQVEEARNTVLNKAQEFEHAVEHRVSELKHQAQHQVEETRKTAEAAAWWIFGTATISAVVSAIAGGLAAVG